MLGFPELLPVGCMMVKDLEFVEKTVQKDESEVMLFYTTPSLQHTNIQTSIWLWWLIVAKATKMLVIYPLLLKSSKKDLSLNRAWKLTGCDLCVMESLRNSLWKKTLWHKEGSEGREDKALPHRTLNFSWLPFSKFWSEINCSLLWVHV